MMHLRHFLKRIAILVLTVVTVFTALASDFETAKAAGIPEMFYVTYWDIVYTIGRTVGYEVTYNNITNSDTRVSGKEMWDDFVEAACSLTYLDEAVVAGEIARDMLDDQIRAFMKGGVTADGEITMSQELYDYFKTYFGAIETYTDIIDSTTVTPPAGSSQKFPLSAAAVNAAILSAWIVRGLHLTKPWTPTYIKEPMLEDFGRYYILCADCRGRATDDATPCSFALYGTNSDGIYVTESGSLRYLDKDGSEHSALFKTCVKNSGEYSSRENINVYGYMDIIRSQRIIATNIPLLQKDLPVVRAQTSASACPAEVPESIPLKKHPAIPDGWRIVNPNEVPDQDPDEKPDIVYPVIPFKHPSKPNPDGTEDPGETENPDNTEKPDNTENPDPDSSENPDKKKNPGLFPWLDWQIDPNTGFRINPYTGQLYDPETGQLIDPETGEIIDSSSGGNAASDVGGSIKELFPFCIPFDIIRLVRGMQAEKAPPVFHFEYYFKGIDYLFTVDIDLTDYDRYIQIFRVGMQIFWILALMFLTVKISKLFI